MNFTRRAALGLIAGGGLLAASESFGFSTVSSNRAVRVNSATDSDALLRIEKLLEEDETVDGDDIEVLRITNRTGEALNPFDVSVDVDEGLEIAEGGEFDTELSAGEYTTLSVSRVCQGGIRSGFTSVEVDVNQAEGNAVSIQHLSRSFLIERTCPGGDDGAFFDVEITATDSPVDDGDDLEVEVTVQNIGTETDTQEIVLEIDESRVDDRELEIDAGEAESVTLIWSGASVGQHDALVVSDDDSESATVEVEGEGTYVVESVSLDDGQGNSIEVTAQIRTDDEEPQLEIREIEDDGSIGDEATIDPSDLPYDIGNQNHAAEIEVRLLDGDGSVRDSRTAEWDG